MVQRAALVHHRLHHPLVHNYTSLLDGRLNVRADSIKVGIFCSQTLSERGPFDTHKFGNKVKPELRANLLSNTQSESSQHCRRKLMDLPITNTLFAVS